MTNEESPGVRMHWGVRIPLRDGIRLNATVYTPKSQHVATPCVFMLTPYVSDTWHGLAVYFAQRGLPFICVDVRGRGNSEGRFRPRLQEAHDGYDVVEWLARQPYCDGKVAMYGASYLGYAQWATAKEFPEHLATIVPAAAPFLGVDVPMRNNIFSPYYVRWLMYTRGRASQARLFADEAFWSALYREGHESGRPFRELDRPLGGPLPEFQEYLDHPEPDAWWDRFNPTPEQYSRLQLPILTITGSYDDDQPGALEHYKQHLRYAREPARQRHFLVIGPWDHAGTSWPSAEFGGLKLGPAAVIDIRGLHLDWYRWTLCGGPRPEFLRKRVCYYVMGTDSWRYADTLEEVTSHQQPYFLHSDGVANDPFSSGALRATPGAGGPDEYRYDPCDTSGPEVAAEAHADSGSLIDQSVVNALSGRLLIYHSAPFETALEIAGFFKLAVWLAIDCPDTDWYVSVYDIDCNGGSILLTTDGMRARYREGLRKPRLIETAEPLRYDFERFTFIARRIDRGHRLRLVIAPVGRLLQSTFTQKNYNGGGVVAEESSADARAVTVKLFHDATHPSALYVPIGQRQQ